MSKEDDVREILNEAVQEIAQAQNNPRTWLSWIVYLPIVSPIWRCSPPCRTKSGTVPVQGAGTRKTTL
jgi:hypothetical protein